LAASISTEQFLIVDTIGGLLFTVCVALRDIVVCPQVKIMNERGIGLAG
jgi:hypothetical protein